LTHTKKTGYDRSGRCMAELNAQEKSNRYAVQQEARKMRHAEMMSGTIVSPGEWLELKWNAFLGFPELDKKKIKHAKKKIGKGQFDSVIKLGEQGDEKLKETLESIKKLNPVSMVGAAGSLVDKVNPVRLVTRPKPDRPEGSDAGGEASADGAKPKATNKNTKEMV